VFLVALPAILFGSFGEASVQCNQKQEEYYIESDGEDDFFFEHPYRFYPSYAYGTVPLLVSALCLFLYLVNIPNTQFSEKRQELYRVVGLYYLFRNVNNLLILLTNILLPCYRNTLNDALFGGVQGVLYIATGGAAGNIIMNWFLLKKAFLLSPFFTLGDAKLLRRLEILFKIESAAVTITVVASLMLFALGFRQTSYFFQGVTLILQCFIKGLYSVVCTVLFLRPVRQRLDLLAARPPPQGAAASQRSRLMRGGTGPNALGLDISSVIGRDHNTARILGESGSEALPDIQVSAPTESDTILHSVAGGMLAVGSSIVAYSLYSYCLLNGLNAAGPRNTAWSHPLNPWLVLSIDFVANDIGVLLTSGIYQNLKRTRFLLHSPPLASAPAFSAYGDSSTSTAITLHSKSSGDVGRSDFSDTDYLNNAVEGHENAAHANTSFELDITY
jgi:hypothetical protein